MSNGLFFRDVEVEENESLYYFNARWYDPQLGRFISQDPIRDGLNWYAYCANNPLKYIDPTGLHNQTPNFGPYGDGGKYSLHQKRTNAAARNMSYSYNDNGERVYGHWQNVQEGDKIWTLKRDFGVDESWKNQDIADLSGINDKDTIYVGDTVFLPSGSKNNNWGYSRGHGDEGNYSTGSKRSAKPPKTVPPNKGGGRPRLTVNDNNGGTESDSRRNFVRTYPNDIDDALKRLVNLNTESNPTLKGYIAILIILHADGNIRVKDLGYEGYGRGSTKGDYQPGDSYIRVDDSLSSDELIGTLIHEVTHYVQYLTGAFDSYGFEDERQAFDNQYEVMKLVAPAKAEKVTNEQILEGYSKVFNEVNNGLGLNPSYGPGF